MTASPSTRPLARSLLAALLATTALVAPLPGLAQSLPTGARVVSGAVSVGTPADNALVITQASRTAIVNWQGFSIGQGSRVEIRQPDAGAAILNRVTGATPSTIAGQLKADGQVYLVNPNGIAITRSGVVSAGGGFVASSLDITDRDFTAGKRVFLGGGASAAVTNAGTVSVGRGGYAALLGGRAANGGSITVPMGRVGLGSGEQATLDLSGDGFLQVAMPTKAGGAGALVSNEGVIRSAGGSITLSAAAAREMARQAVNLSGTVEARGVAGRSGDIVLSGGEGVVSARGRIDAAGAGGARGGRVRITGRRLDVAGTVDASGGTGGRVSLRGSEGLGLSGSVAARGTAGTGGLVEATAPAVALRGASLDASGTAGGGTVHLGGRRQGGGPLAHAQTVEVDGATTILADAAVSGRGGEVVVWSDAATRFAGTITARGGGQAGDGGNAEVSSKGHLAYAGTADLTAARGAFGTLLLDPHNVTISGDADKASSGFTASGDDSVVNATTLLTALKLANVTVSTGTDGTQAGTIALAANTPLSWTSGATLTLQAAGGITLNSDVAAAAGGLTLSSGGQITPSAGVSVARFTLASGQWVQNTATLPAFATANFQIAGGSFLRVTGGDGSAGTPYQIADVYGLQGLPLNSSSVLVADIDATGTSTWNAGDGFKPLGSETAPFSGTLDGRSHLIRSLFVGPKSGNAGLFDQTNGTITGMSLEDVSVIATTESSTAAGILAAVNSGTIRNSHATGYIDGNTVGGLIGKNTGTVENSYADASVYGQGFIGGLVGINDISGKLTAVYATGGVSGMGSGGFTATSTVGGLVGQNVGTITRAYASGIVSGTGNLGGLVGTNKRDGGRSGPVSGTLTDTFWDKASTTQSSASSDKSASTGVTGLASADARNSAKYTNFDFNQVWFQAGDMRPILRSEVAPADANGVVAVSNLHQLALMETNLSGKYLLTRNLDAYDTSVYDASNPFVWGPAGFAPVGTGGNDGKDTFSGTFDGGGHVVTGLVIKGSNAVAGLFGSASDATIKNVGLFGGSIKGASYVGALVGYALRGQITNSYFTSGAIDTSGGTGTAFGGLVGYGYGVTITKSYATSTVSGATTAGGLVGLTAGTSTITDSYATGDVTAVQQAGGLVGSNASTIARAYATGTVTATSTDAAGSTTSGRAGGLVGDNTGTVSETWASGKVTGTAAGGLIGKNAGTVSTAFWDKDTTGQANAYGSTDTGSSGTPVGLSNSDARKAASYTGFDFTKSWYQGGGIRPILRAEAADADPVTGVVPVSNIHQLQLMDANPAGQYRLAARINASDTKSNDLSTGIWGAAGFAPVGGSTAFTGSFDGQNLTTYLLTVNASGAQAGLFGTVGAAGSVKNISIMDMTITGSGAVGTLIGDNFGTVTVVSAYGKVTNNSSDPGSGTGGLIGKNEAGATITQVSAGGSATGGAAVGGLVGINAGTLSKAYVNVATKGAGAVGGLVGTNSGTVAQVYALGAVSGPDNSNNGSAPTPEPSLGGLFGSVSNGSAVTAALWNTQTTKQSQGTGTGSTTGMTGLTTDQMHDFTSYKTNYAGFDFVSTWAVPNKAGQSGQNNSNYPQLFSLSYVVVASFDGHVSYTGQAPGDLVASYSPLRPGTFVTALSTVKFPATAVDAGTYTATVSSNVRTSNYDRPIIIDTGTLVIDPKVLNVAGSKTYDGKTGFSTLQMSATGAAQGQTVTLAATGTGDAATASSADAGIYTDGSLAGLTFTVTGGKASNYALPGTGTLRIAKAVIGLTGQKTYDGSGLFTLGQLSASGPVSGESVSLTGPTGAIVSAPSGNAGTSDTITITGLGFNVSGGKASNYILSTTGTLTITPKALTASLAGPVSKTYDGTNAATLTADNYTLDGVVQGDTVSISGTGAYDTANAGTGKTVTVTDLILGGNGAGNYTLTGTTASGAVGTIGKAMLTASLTGTVSKTYDGTTSATLTADNYTLAGVVQGETVSVSGTGAYDTANAGTGKTVTATGLTLGGDGASNYTLTGTTASGAVGTIGKAMLTASLTGTVSKTYDGTTSATLTADNYTLAGVVQGDTVSISGTGAYDTANAGTGKTVTVTDLTLGGNGAGNYTLTGTTASGAIGTIGKASLTVTAKDASKTYDGRAFSGGNGASYTGLVAGEDASVLGGTLAYGGTAQGAKDAGSYGLTASGLTSDNYAIQFQDGVLTVAKAPLTASLAGTVSKTYDGTKAATLTADNYALDGVVQGETVSLSGAATYDTANAGTGKTVTATGLTLGGNGASNYTLTGTTASGAVGTIGKAMLTASLAGTVSKTYDGTKAATLTADNYALDGVIRGETVSVSGTGAYDTANAGTGKTVTATGLTLGGDGAGNYTLTGTTASGSIGTIGKAALTVTAKDASKTYDGQAFSGGNGASYTGLVAGEDASVLGGTLAYGGTAQGAKNAGSYGLTASGLTSDNYAIQFQDGVLTVAKAPLTASLTGTVSKTYDGTTSATLTADNYALDGVIRGETVSVSGTGAYDTANAGTGKTVTATGLTLGGDGAGNYTLTGTTASGAVGTIGKASLTVTAKDASKTYDGQAFGGGNGVSYAGFVAGEDASVLGGTLAYGGTAQGAKNAGRYALTASGLTSGNYSIEFQDGTLTVARAPLTVTAADAAKTYDGQAFGGGNGVTYAGFVAGEDASVLGGTLAYGGAAQGAKNAGRYALTASGLTSGNYAIAFQDGALTVAPAPVEVTAASGRSVYGDSPANPGLTAKGLQNGEGVDALTGLSNSFGVNARSGVADSPYRLTVAGTLSNGNYTVSARRDGTWTVSPRALSVTADPVSRTAGAANPPLTYTTAGLLTGDTLSGGLATSADGASPAGRYAITQGTLAAGGNYALSYTGADLTVTAITASTVPSTSVGPQLASTASSNPQSGSSGSSPTQSTGNQGRIDGTDLTNRRFDTPVVCVGGAGGCVSAPTSQKKRRVDG